MFTMQFFLLGLQDIFITFMMWFAFDEQNKPIFFENHQTGEIYQNLDVISNSESDENLT